ncbi:hypothetical protein ABZS81_24290 [Streptomyces sp. NPDC005318]|uniref:hypothetical protein n=1 Tax=Streptomyces sp. NPDC005318 TaxID=3157031 RepID=UPI0033B24D67
MTRPVRREDQVRRMLDGPHPQLPAGLAEQAAVRGGRLLRRRRAARTLALTVLFVAVAAFVVWAVVAQPWQVPPTDTTPPLEGW